MSNKWVGYRRITLFMTAWLDSHDDREAHMKSWRLWPFWSTGKHWPWPKYSVYLLRERKK